MIEVTQKDLKGRIQTIGWFTEEQFGYRYTWYDDKDILEAFGTEHKMIGSHEERVERVGKEDVWRRVADFNFVAYNEKGDVLDPTYLVGVARKYTSRRRYRRGYNSWAKRVWHRGCRMRLLHTTPERRAAFACEDQEEYAPKVRARRNAKNLPETWDDYWRYNQRNWKKFRKHQWKEND